MVGLKAVICFQGLSVISTRFDNRALKLLGQVVQALGTLTGVLTVQTMVGANALRLSNESKLQLQALLLTCSGSISTAPSKCACPRRAAASSQVVKTC